MLQSTGIGIASAFVDTRLLSSPAAIVVLVAPFLNSFTFVL